MLAELGIEPGHAQEAGRSTFRAGVEIVRLPITVRGEDDRIVTTLSRGDFRVFVDGRPVEIELFSTRTRPLAVALLFNTSTNGEVLEHYRALGRAFVDALDPLDRATIGSFSHEVALSPFVTSDRTKLYRVLAEELWHGWGNSLGTAVDLALTALAGQTGKRAVVVVGPDTRAGCLAHQPCIGLGSATARTRDEDVSAYGIRVPMPHDSRLGGDSPVRDLALRTGGGYLRLQPTDNLIEAMAEVVRELRHEYVLGFRPPVRDGRSHRVEVRANPGLTVWSRKNYPADSQ
jgi:Ca-activated chloride channel family protein